MKPYSGLRLSQVERKVAALEKAKKAAATNNGWIRLVRNTLGMTMKTLADRLKIDQSSVARMEQRELSQRITLDKLSQVADALGCDLVYGFVPRKTFAEEIDTQALAKAQRLLQQAGTHMALEDQDVTAGKEERLQRLKDKLIKDGDIW